MNSIVIFCKYLFVFQLSELLTWYVYYLLDKRGLLPIGFSNSETDIIFFIRLQSKE